MTKALKELWDECVEIIRDNISPKHNHKGFRKGSPAKLYYLSDSGH